MASVECREPKRRASEPRKAFASETRRRLGERRATDGTRSLLVALSLLASAATAYAEGAWVLWTRMEDVSSRNDKWKDWSNGGGEAYPTYAERQDAHQHST